MPAWLFVCMLVHVFLGIGACCAWMSLSTFGSLRAELSMGVTYVNLCSPRQRQRTALHLEYTASRRSRVHRAGQTLPPRRSGCTLWFRCHSLDDCVPYHVWPASYIVECAWPSSSGYRRTPVRRGGATHGCMLDQVPGTLRGRLRFVSRSLLVRASLRAAHTCQGNRIQFCTGAACHTFDGDCISVPQHGLFADLALGLGPKRRESGP